MVTISMSERLPERVVIPGFNCRFCEAPLEYSFVDLRMSPLCQNIVKPEDLNRSETFYPLHAFVCEHCHLVQLDSYVDPSDIFTEYAYFSSYSDYWLAHVKKYAHTMIERFGLTPDSQVVEVASNDGYALQYFVEAGIPSLGVEPAANVAKVAQEKGIDTRVVFFGRESARQLANEGYSADLLYGKNVLAQVLDLNDFVAGMKILLKPGGVITVEFPHLMRLMEENQFDTIYHEHFGYFSFVTATKIFAAHGIRLFDVEELPTHGGSIRIIGCHDNDESKPVTERAREMISRETAAGLTGLAAYSEFAERVRETKRKLVEFLVDAKRQGKTIAGYGAPGKGNTLLNYCGIGTDFVDFTVDRNPYKQNTYLPGSRIPVYEPDKIFEAKPDYLLILPWNLKDEIVKQMAEIREWGGQFVVPIPEVTVIP